MVRFADVTAGATPDESRAEPHRITLEDGDMGPALKAITPYIDWRSDVDGNLTLPYAEFLDITARHLTIHADARGDIEG